MPRVSYEEYLIAVALTLARRHRPVWSWERWRKVCRCGSELPCRTTHRIPINRGHWPSEDNRRGARPADQPAPRGIPR
ncbi:hypothetical protein CO540_18255 [Micromonospora sp. WMMA2032]|nr:hypothetical protein CO540_18255 [Micromonospora sp. WMMA2032]